MLNKQILKKAIEKAVKNGWHEKEARDATPSLIASAILGAYNRKINTLNWYYPIIFDHDFAKAFWGEELARWSGNVFNINWTRQMPEWEHHLQRLALAKDRLKYLEKFLKK